MTAKKAGVVITWEHAEGESPVLSVYLSGRFEKVKDMNLYKAMHFKVGGKERLPKDQVSVTIEGFTTDSGKRGTVVILNYPGYQGAFIGASLHDPHDPEDFRQGVKVAVRRSLATVVDDMTESPYFRLLWSAIRRHFRDHGGPERDE